MECCGVCTSAYLPEREQSTHQLGQYQSLSEVAFAFPLVEHPKIRTVLLQINKIARTIAPLCDGMRSNECTRKTEGQSMGSSCPIGLLESAHERPECTHTHKDTAHVSKRCHHHSNRQRFGWLPCHIK